jgi:hypothetical protein
MPTFLATWLTEPIPQLTRFNPEDGSSMFLRNAGIRLQTTRYRNPEDDNLNNNRYENLKTYQLFLILCRRENNSKAMGLYSMDGPQSPRLVQSVWAEIQTKQELNRSIRLASHGTGSRNLLNVTRRVFSQVVQVKSTYSTNQGIFRRQRYGKKSPVYVCLNFPPANGYQKYIKNGIHSLSNDYVTVFVTN